jgi:hypothetical protein
MFKPAFRDINGKVVTTGQFHNIDELPVNFEIQDEGFVDDNGLFKTRHEVTEQLHADHEIQSEELNKVQKPPDFSELGVEYRPQTPVVSPQQASTKRKLMVNAASTQGIKLKAPQAKRGTFVAGLTGPAKTGTDISYALKRPGAGAVQIHEDLHQMFNRVHAKHGADARVNLASNLYNAVPEENRNAMREYVNHTTGGKEPPANRWHEEHLAHLLSYLNSHPDRMTFHQKQGTWDNNLKSLTPKGKDFNIKMKQAHRFVQQAAKKADNRWLKQFIHKSEINLLQKSNQWQPSEQEIELALDMLHAYHDEIPEFKAAKFLSGGYQPSQEEVEQALREHDGEYEVAALEAHHLQINDENIRNVRKMAYLYIKQDGLTKSEENVAAIPRVVKPFNEEAIHVADLVRTAFEHNDVHQIKLKGKHSKGTALIKDYNTGDLWLLKPGSGHLSPAAGISEEKADQATREVAFNDCARILQMGQYVPNSALLKLDGENVSALFFFPIDYRPVEKLKKNNLETLRQVFQRMVLNGLLYKFAILDGLLANCDRHAGNILINEGEDVRLIDGGTTFAGPSFNPGTDSQNTFVPFYLRVFSDRKFNVLTPQEKYAIMPSVTKEVDLALAAWVNSISDGQLVAKMNEYGINPDPVINRLKKLRAYPGSKCDYVRKCWAGLDNWN